MQEVASNATRNGVDRCGSPNNERSEVDGRQWCNSAGTCLIYPDHDHAHGMHRHHLNNLHSDASDSAIVGTDYSCSIQDTNFLSAPSPKWASKGQWDLWWEAYVHYDDLWDNLYEYQSILNSTLDDAVALELANAMNEEERCLRQFCDVMAMINASYPVNVKCVQGNRAYAKVLPPNEKFIFLGHVLIGKLLRDRKCLALVFHAAHEIAHHYGGNPKMPGAKSFATCEGKSDHWAAFCAMPAALMNPSMIEQVAHDLFPRASVQHPSAFEPCEIGVHACCEQHRNKHCRKRCFVDGANQIQETPNCTWGGDASTTHWENYWKISDCGTTP